MNKHTHQGQAGMKTCDPLTTREAEAILKTIGECERSLQLFVGWMVQSGKYSGKVAADIRSFAEAHKGGRL